MIKKKNDERIGDVLSRMYAKGKMGDKLKQNTITEIWYRRMGEPIQRRTGKISLFKGELKIEIISAALRNDLYHRKDQIMTMINEELGETIVRSVVIR